MANRRKSKKNRILSGLNGRSIVLVGMMGCGKSAIGRMLAKPLGLEFRDADAEIEIAADRTIPEIFAEFGEPEFRRLEERVISRLLEEGPYVLALGGGAFINDDTRRTVLEKGLSIWLDVHIEVLLDRVLRKPGKRPLLETGDPRKILSDLMTQRGPVYSKADLRINSQGGTKSEMRNLVMNRIDEYLASTREIAA